MASQRPLQSAVLAEAWEVTGTQPSPTGRLHLMAEGELRSGNMNVAVDWAAQHRGTNIVLVGGRRFAAASPDIAAAMHRAALGRRTNWCAYHHDGRPEWPAFWIKLPDHTPIRLLHDLSHPGHIQVSCQPNGRNAWINPEDITLPVTAAQRPLTLLGRSMLHLVDADRTIELGHGTPSVLEQILGPLNTWLTSQRTIEPETPMTSTVTFTTLNGDWSTAVITIADWGAPIGIAEQPATWLQHTIDDNVELNVQAGKHLEKYRLPFRIAELIHDAIIQLVAGTFTTGLWNLLAQRIAAAGWEAIHRYSGHITFDPTQAAPPTLPKETWDVWDGMTTDIRTDALYVVSGQRLANILGDRRVLNNLRNGGTETIDGKTYRLVDTAGLHRAFGQLVEAHTLDEPDDDDVHDGDAWG